MTPETSNDSSGRPPGCYPNGVYLQRHPRSSGAVHAEAPDVALPGYKIWLSAWRSDAGHTTTSNRREPEGEWQHQRHDVQPQQPRSCPRTRHTRESPIRRGNEAAGERILPSHANLILANWPLEMGSMAAGLQDGHSNHTL